MAARDQLKDIVTKGITIDLFEAERAMAILNLVGNRADDVNKAKFGEFFGGLQLVLGRYVVLCVAKFFEPTSKRNNIRSIPAALDLIEKSADKLLVENRSTLIRQLLTRSVVIPNETAISDKYLNNLLVGYFRNRIPTDKQQPAVNSLFIARDKSVAHNEAIAVSGPTFDELDHLIALAQEFVCLVGPAYLNTFYSGDDNQYMLTSDAQRSSRCLKRILKAAGVQDNGGDTQC